MKKLLVIIFLSLFLVINNIEAKTTAFTKGQYYEGSVLLHSANIELPPGEWQYTVSDSWNFGGYGIKEWWFFQTENNKLKSSFSLAKSQTGGKYLSYLGPYLYNQYTRGKYDSCTLRPEYYAAKLYAKGNTSNCFRVAHVELYKAFYNPDNPDRRGSYIGVKQWIKRKDIELPAIMICRGHTYFSPIVRDVGIFIDHCIDPEFFGANKTKFETEERSEYHRQNIEGYPDKKKFMEQWTSLAAEYHKEFEERVGTKDNHKLDLSEYYTGKNNLISDTSSKNISEEISSKNIVEELEVLKNLYEEGVLTKEEFKKAKKKILN